MADFKVRNEETKTPDAAENKNVAAAIPANDPAPAATKKPVKVITIDETEEKLDNVINFSQTYDFEGEKIDTLDLRKIEDLNAIQMQRADNIYRKITKNVVTMPETTYDYAIAVAHILTEYPVEFFKQINAKDLTKIKTRVVAFLYGED